MSTGAKEASCDLERLTIKVLYKVPRMSYLLLSANETRIDRETGVLVSVIQSRGLLYGESRDGEAVEWSLGVTVGLKIVFHETTSHVVSSSS